MANPVPIRFPLGGVSEGAAFAGDPAPNLILPAHCLNVRPHDAIDRRKRGGKRTGISKFFDTRPNSSQVQFLGTATEAVALTEDAGFGAKFANPSTIPHAEVYGISLHPDGKYMASSPSHSFSGFAVNIHEWDDTTGFGNRTTELTSSSYLHSTKTTLSWHPNGLWLTFNHGRSSGGLVSCSFDADTGVLTEDSTASEGSWVCSGQKMHPDGHTVFAWFGTNSDGEFNAYVFDGDTGLGAVRHAAGSPTDQWDVTRDIAILKTSETSCLVAVVSQESPYVRIIEYDTETGFGAVTEPLTAPPSSSGGCTFSPDGAFLVVGLTSGLRIYSVADFDTEGPVSTPFVSGGGGLAPTFDPSGDYILAGTTTELTAWPWLNGDVGDPLFSGGDVGSVRDVAWNAAGTVAFGGADDSPRLIAYEFSGEKVNPSARKSRVVSVQNGSVYRSNYPPSVLALSNDGDSVMDVGFAVSGAAAFQKMFFVDGAAANYCYLDFADNTVKDWSANLTAGALPAGTDDTTLGCRFMVLYRGRVVMSGLREEPQNWFMSKAGDPFDWDYAPAETSPTQAVAGNASNAGELGDACTALAPHQDDILIIGGANSLWMMRGDPAAGGQIDNISRQVGITGPEAWTWDAGSVLWFFGNNGLYRLQPGGAAPELVSKGKLDKTFAELDTSSKTVRLVYDREWQGVHIFITPVNQPDSHEDHWFFDERTGGFWRDQYPVNFGPTAVHLFAADDPDQRGVILGGFDGYLRIFNSSTNDDDGAAIESYVRFPLVHPAMPMGQFQLSDMQLTTDNRSNGVQLDIYRGKTPQEAAEATTAAFTKTLAAGRNLPIRKRLRGNAIQMRLHHNTAAKTWAYEAGTMIIGGVGRQRARL